MQQYSFLMQLKGGNMFLIEISDYKYRVFCDYGNHAFVSHSVGYKGAPQRLRTNICHQCLKEIVIEGLKRFTDEERTEILKEYMLEAIEMQDSEENYKEEVELVANREKIPKKPKEESKASYREKLIVKAKELGVEGKLVTFSNKKLEKEIKNKLGGK